MVWGLVYGKCVPPDIGNEVFYRKCVLGSYLSIATCYVLIDGDYLLIPSCAFSFPCSKTY